MSVPFETERRIRFAHCDPAGIVYYPRYFEICDGVIEDWTAEVIGVPRRILHLDMGLALPTVSLEATFSAPSRIGDRLAIALHTTTVGRTSVGVTIVAVCGDTPRFRFDYVQVLVRMSDTAPVPWPDAWRTRLQHHAASGPPPPARRNLQHGQADEEGMDESDAE